MVNGPGTVIFTLRSVWRRRNFRSSTSTGMLAADFPDDARHRIGMAGAVEGDAGIVDVDPFQRGGEAVRIALPPDLAVGDDVEPRLFLQS